MAASDIAAPAAAPAIRARDLYKGYAQQVAVAGLNLEVPRGSFFGFLLLFFRKLRCDDIFFRFTSAVINNGHFSTPVCKRLPAIGREWMAWLFAGTVNFSLLEYSNNDRRIRS